MKSPNLMIEANAQIIGMNQVGVRVVEIGLELGMPTMTVYTMLQTFKTGKTVISPKQTGQPSRFSDCDK
jgi:hypothetical protein